MALAATVVAQDAHVGQMAVDQVGVQDVVDTILAFLKVRKRLSYEL